MSNRLAHTWRRSLQLRVVVSTLSLSLIVMLVSEWILTDNGLGFYLINAQRNYEITEMWSALLMLALIGYALNTVFLVVERRLLRWHEGASGRGEAR